MSTNYKMKVNGFDIEAQYSDECIDSVLNPLLDKLKEIQMEQQKRIIVFLVAAPAVGKSTLATFLEYLANRRESFPSFQSIGLDGFHYPQEYLNKNYVSIDGVSIPMKDVKGSPETFDIDTIIQKLNEMKKEDITWPIYDRTLHDVVPDKVLVNKEIILIEGNWLLLDEKKWRTLRALSDYSIYIDAEENVLKNRLVARKVMGGLRLSEAEKFYEYSDSKNVKRVLTQSQKADMELYLCENGDYQRKKGQSEKDE